MNRRQMITPPLTNTKCPSCGAIVGVPGTPPEWPCACGYEPPKPKGFDGSPSFEVDEATGTMVARRSKGRRGGGF